MTADFFRNRLDQMIDLRHPLAVLSNRMQWQELEASFVHRFAHQIRAGKRVEDVDLFGPAVSVAGAGVATAGRPRLPTRLMVALLYLKQAFNENDFCAHFRLASWQHWLCWLRPLCLQCFGTCSVFARSRNRRPNRAFYFKVR